MQSLMSADANVIAEDPQRHGETVALKNGAKNYRYGRL
jgi:hypothetical protein